MPGPNNIHIQSTQEVVRREGEAIVVADVLRAMLSFHITSVRVPTRGNTGVRKGGEQDTHDCRVVQQVVQPALADNVLHRLRYRINALHVRGVEQQDV